MSTTTTCQEASYFILVFEVDCNTTTCLFQYEGLESDLLTHTHAISCRHGYHLLQTWVSRQIRRVIETKIEQCLTIHHCKQIYIGNMALRVNCYM